MWVEQISCLLSNGSFINDPNVHLNFLYSCLSPLLWIMTAKNRKAVGKSRFVFLNYFSFLYRDQWFHAIFFPNVSAKTKYIFSLKRQTVFFHFTINSTNFVSFNWLLSIFMEWWFLCFPSLFFMLLQKALMTNSTWGYSQICSKWPSVTNLVFVNVHLKKSCDFN